MGLRSAFSALSLANCGALWPKQYVSTADIKLSLYCFHREATAAVTTVAMT